MCWKGEERKNLLLGRGKHVGADLLARELSRRARGEGKESGGGGGVGGFTLARALLARPGY